MSRGQHAGRSGWAGQAKAQRGKGAPTKRKRRQQAARLQPDPEVLPKVRWRPEDEAVERRARHGR